MKFSNASSGKSSEKSRRVHSPKPNSSKAKVYSIAAVELYFSRRSRCWRFLPSFICFISFYYVFFWAIGKVEKSRSWSPSCETCPADSYVSLKRNFFRTLRFSERFAAEVWLLFAVLFVSDAYRLDFFVFRQKNK